jgi:hypothetical protein
MFLDAELHAAYKIANAPILNFPFPHLYIENIFSDDFYSKIQENLPETEEMTSMPDLYSDTAPLSKYKDRLIVDFALEESMKKIRKNKREFWTSFEKNFSENIGNLLRLKLKNYLDLRFQYLENVSFTHQMLIVNDKKNYLLGPHTDKPNKVISVLIYLPKDRSQIETGTSLYVPKDSNSLDKRFPSQHYSHDKFHKVITIPFIPNSAFCFLKTNNSYHGVEKLQREDANRWSLQYNLYLTDESLEKEIIARKKHKKNNNSHDSIPKTS